jgi:hypothetical protein
MHELSITLNARDFWDLDVGVRVRLIEWLQQQNIPTNITTMLLGQGEVICTRSICVGESIVNHYWISELPPRAAFLRTKDSERTETVEADPSE